MDALLQQPGTVDGLFETRMREIAATVDPDPADPSPWTDGDLDLAKWGVSVYFATNRPREEVERVVAGYLAPRRAYLFNTGSGRVSLNGSTIPDAAQTNVPGMVVFDGLDYLPAGGTQSNEYVILRNATSQAVDISGWRVAGEIEHTFKGGTVIPAGDGSAASAYVGLLHLAKDAASFRRRGVGPTGGERRFVQGNYSGQLSARGGTLRLYDAGGQLIATCAYAGTPLPTQESLRITELQYHPAAPTSAESAALVGVKREDFEYLELSNIGSNALALGGAYFSQGIAYTFSSIALAAGERIVLAKSPTAFRLRYPSVTAPLVGPYEGDLANGGERLELKDVCGETILDFTYKDGWFPATDGTGRSLVLRDPSVAYSAFGDAVSWGVSGEAEGSPGTADAALAQTYYGWDNFHFTADERDDAAIAGPYADPDGDGRVNWLEYALGCDPRVPDKASVGLCFVEAAAQQHAGLVFNRMPNALDVSYSIWATGDLRWELWQPVAWSLHQVQPCSECRETVILREDAAATPRQRFYQLRLTFE